MESQAIKPTFKPMVLLKLLRPRQWTKNFIAFAPALFAGRLFEPQVIAHLSLCVLALCLLSGAIYVFNDILDREADRKHPTKCLRPLASGAVSVQTALIVAGLSLTLSFVLAYLVRPALALVFLAYLILQIAYTFRLKKRVILDVFCIACGFVLRALAGGAAVHVPLSAWFLLCTSLGALFLALEKRRQEFRALGPEAAAHRAVLGKYSLDLLDRMEAVIVPTLVTAYAFYSFQSSYGQWMMITVPMVLYGILRYQVLSVRDNSTGTPEEVLLKDRPIQNTIVVWILACMAVVYGWLPKLATWLVATFDSFSLRQGWF
ncbi:MAG: decaprenyl-phosphate phosphoribosyltransferase [Cyanobacteria bacterium SZAS LIN-3]|nr:decaprenyl-phosphate phosphoribosyltransferase [Cyanobacteria bacterium SZAS LIN-3]